MIAPVHMSDLPTWREFATNGIRMAAMVGKTSAQAPVAVVFLHGFPELAYSWRHQIRAILAAGFDVVAPDLRGYGRTGPQGAATDYRLANLALDVVGLLDALEISHAVVVGHDFGGALAWTLARDHADRVLGIVSLNTPYTMRTSTDLLGTILRVRGPQHYMAVFQTPGIGEQLLEADVSATFRGLMRRPKVSLAEFNRLPQRIRLLPATLFVGEPELMGDPLLDDEDLGVFVDAYQRTGFTGALNWYRNLVRNWEDTANTSDIVEVPALMVTAADDYFLPPGTAHGMEAIVPRLDRHLIAECGHWTQQERPDEVNVLLVDWLRKRILPEIKAG